MNKLVCFNLSRSMKMEQRKKPPDVEQPFWWIYGDEIIRTSVIIKVAVCEHLLCAKALAYPGY